jgi:hypothetical protein
LGCNHDRGTKNECNGLNYNYGYRDPNAAFRTILAYSCTSNQCDNNVGGGCSRIPRFSNPNYTFNGRALGTATEDNVRQMNDVIEEVAGYYPHVPKPHGCSDTTLRFKTVMNGKKIFRYCTWVANQSTVYRCGLDGVSSMCPVTCGTCEVCIDGTARFKVEYNDKKITRDCTWVSKKATSQRCSLDDGISYACRSTCALC